MNKPGWLGSTLDPHQIRWVEWAFGQIKERAKTLRRCTTQRGRPVYRSGDNRSFVGVLLGDDYDKSMERWELRKVMRAIPNVPYALAAELQMIHDEYSPERWGQAIERCERRWIWTK